MHSEAIGSNRKQSEAIGSNRKHSVTESSKSRRRCSSAQSATAAT